MEYVCDEGLTKLELSGYFKNFLYSYIEGEMAKFEFTFDSEIGPTCKTSSLWAKTPAYTEYASRVPSPVCTQCGLRVDSVSAAPGECLPLDGMTLPEACEADVLELGVVAERLSSSSTAPAPMGGAILAGTYALREHIAYDGAPSPTEDVSQILVLDADGTGETASMSEGDEFHADFMWEHNGVDFAMSYTCPEAQAGLTSGGPYTATETSLTLFQKDGTALVFQR